MAGQRSSSLLHHVIHGKRNLTPATTRAFCKALSLNAEEAGFFSLLVALDQAATHEERNQIYSRLSATRRFREARRVEGEGFRYLSAWYYPAIRELSHAPDFRADPAWICKALRPPITQAQARAALEDLVSMGLVVLTQHGGAEPAEASVVTAHEVVDLGVFNYHHGMIERSRHALEHVEPEERHFGAVTVAVPAHLVARLKEEVSRFQERLLDLCDDEEARKGQPVDVVYQVNLQLFPPQPQARWRGLSCVHLRSPG